MHGRHGVTMSCDNTEGASCREGSKWRAVCTPAASGRQCVFFICPKGGCREQETRRCACCIAGVRESWIRGSNASAALRPYGNLVKQVLAADALPLLCKPSVEAADFDKVANQLSGLVKVSDCFDFCFEWLGGCTSCYTRHLSAFPPLDGIATSVATAAFTRDQVPRAFVTRDLANPDRATLEAYAAARHDAATNAGAMPYHARPPLAVAEYVDMGIVQLPLNTLDKLESLDKIEACQTGYVQPARVFLRVATWQHVGKEDELPARNQIYSPGLVGEQVGGFFRAPQEDAAYATNQGPGILLSIARA